MYLKESLNAPVEAVFLIDNDCIFWKSFNQK